MSKQTPSSDDNPVMIFLRGFWELPTERPNLSLSFLRGAIVSVIISLIFGYTSMAELLAWAIFLGLFWAAIDQFVWNYYSKKKGE